MTTSVNQSHSTPSLLPSRRMLWTLRLLSFTALSISGYLAWTAFNAQEVYGCGSGEVFDCGHVLTSQYAKVFGVPVSAPAFGLYAAMLTVMLFFRQGVPEKLMRMGWGIISVGGLAAGMAALWFTGIQIFELEHLCLYCLGAHACGLTIAGIVIWHHPLGGKVTSALSSLSVAGVAGLIATQMMAEPPQTFMVERFDESDQLLASTDAADSSPDIFGAPVAFDAPVEAVGDIFAPPVVSDNEFAPPSDAIPADSGTTVESESTDDSSAEDVISDADETQPLTDASEVPVEEPVAEPAVAATAILLFISPSTSALAANFLAVSDETATTDSGAEDESDETPAEEPKAEAPKERLVSVSGNKFSLNTRHWPLLGEPDAKYVFVEMFDYTCPHCRRTHQAIDGAFKKYGDDLAVIALPVPLDGSCNDTVRNTSASHRSACELARISVAVWRVDRLKFKEFHDWMFDGNRSAKAARSHAEKLVGKDKLKAELDLPHAKNYITKHVELYKRVGRGSVPKIMFPKSTMTGEVSSTNTLCRTIERELGK